jgi:spore protease
MSPKEGVYLVAGLGNRFATPDALGPFVLDDVEVNRHVSVETPWEEPGSKKVLCALSPGVMGQTGMESQEILGGIIDKVHPCCLLVVDSLATRSIHRLCNTIQITDTGICPGAGIGNNRNELSREKLNIPVIAIGVPTVVDAGTIVSECMEETLLKEGYTMEQIDLFLRGLSKHSMESLFVTPKDIDEQVRTIGKVVAKGINLFAMGK